MEYIVGLMGENMKENGLMGNNMGKVGMFCLMELLKMGYGKMVNA